MKNLYLHNQISSLRSDNPTIGIDRRPCNRLSSFNGLGYFAFLLLETQQCFQELYPGSFMMFMGAELS